MWEPGAEREARTWRVEVLPHAPVELAHVLLHHAAIEAARHGAVRVRAEARQAATQEVLEALGFHLSPATGRQAWAAVLSWLDHEHVITT